MQKFQFSLESALEYRDLQVDLERAKLERLYLQLRQLDAQRDALAEEAAAANLFAKGLEPKPSMLYALDSFSRFARSRRQALEADRSRVLRMIDEQQSVVVGAKTDYELLVKARQAKYAEWVRAADKELEVQAEESHAAGWVRDLRSRRRKTG